MNKHTTGRYYRMADGPRGRTLMANPQLENGYLRLANELAEAFSRTNLAPYEWRVLWAILRRTYGWQKKTDVISLSQLSDATGLERRHMHRALCSLITQGYVTRERYGVSWEYGLQKDYTLWGSTSLGTSADTGTSASLGTTPSASLGTKTSAGLGTHKRKKESSKERSSSTKPSDKPMDNRAQQLITHYTEQYEALRGTKPAILQKDAGSVKCVTKVVADLVLLKAAVDCYLLSSEPFAVKSGHPLSLFVKDINRWLGEARAGPRMVALQGDTVITTKGGSPWKH